MGRMGWLVLLGTAVATAGMASVHHTATLTIRADRPGPAVSPLLWGVFFEEINRAGDGGLLAEMLQNRSFEDDANAMPGWTPVGKAVAALDRSRPLNDRNPAALRLVLRSAGDGVANAGFGRPARDGQPAYAGGLAIRAGRPLILSLFQQADSPVKPLEARLEAAGGTVLARARLPAAGTAWSRTESRLVPSGDADDGRLVIAGTGAGEVRLDHVSLVPVDTWKGHGLRPDLAGLIAAMRPAFVRFPGGCFVEGWNRANALRWKDSIGDPVSRRGVGNLWGYRTTGGFGFHEFLQWCEDLDAQPLYVINAGMGHGFAVPMQEMGEWVQDALDLVEYARSPADSPWGARRAAAGHPKPFPLNLIEIGNENGGPEYNERYALFHDALKKRYPDIQLIANVWNGVPDSRPRDLDDEHAYMDVDGCLARAGSYDARPRTGPKVYFGEYAVTSGCGHGNLAAAVAEAALMTGIEANSDLVTMASYAPLLVHPAWRAWNPNAIVFDHARAYGTPSYHVQALFASNRPESNCPVAIRQPDLPLPAPRGWFGVGTWETQAEFKDVSYVTPDGREHLAAGAGLDAWTTAGGTWSVADGLLRQTGGGTPAMAVSKIGQLGDGTISMKARKTGGKEGFLILFQAADHSQHRWWNLGGWGNTRHGIEQVTGNPRVPGSIETGRWYDVRIELAGPRIRCYLDGALVQDVVREVPQSVYAVAGLTRDRRELIVKAVNTSSVTVDAAWTLQGVTPVPAPGTVTVLTSASPADENSFEVPDRVAPATSPFSSAGPRFARALPPWSVTIIRLHLVP